MAENLDFSLRGTDVDALSESVIRQVFGGRLFTDVFLAEHLIQLANTESAYRIDDEVSRLYDEAKAIFDKAPATYQLNEDETQVDFIYPILDILKWQDRAIKKNLGLSRKDLRQVPDGLLFLDKEAKAKTRNLENNESPYPFGKVVLENKRWQLPLESREKKKEKNLISPSMQILTYLNRATVLSNNKIQWGFLTNGAEWRLYYQKAQSMAEQFFAVRLDRIFANDSLLSREDKLACFKIFLLTFGKQAFQHGFHEQALGKVKSYQQGITEKLASEIFNKIYEYLAIAIAEQAERATGEEIKQASLKILYRILFILYAEDRELLPMGEHDAYKQHYSLKRLRRRLQEEGIPRASDVFSLWDAIKNLCKIINEGNSGLGVPKYNGRLFKDGDTKLLSKIKIPDSVMGETLYALSYHRGKYVNYRNLNVEQLGTIYENLLERDMIKESGKLKIFISKDKRKKTGSYYTPEELVSLVIKEATDSAYKKYIDAFKDKVVILEKNKNKGDAEKNKILHSLDPAIAILNQKICDPAMGSGHFLVSLTDNLTDQVIKAMGEAENEALEGWKYQSPIRKRIDEINDTIRDNAKNNGHKLNEEHLQDRHIIRRIVLKSCIYGVDKNPMAVELAQLSLWLHTFTVGAPLSFLDHHLKCGDSLFGLRVEDAEVRFEKHGGLLIMGVKEIIKDATKDMREIASLTDSEMSQIEQSKEAYGRVQVKTKPLKQVLSFLHASDWLKELASSKKEKQVSEALMNQLLDGNFGDFFELLQDPEKIPANVPKRQQIIDLIKRIEELSTAENFFHWQIEFPEVWPYQNGHREGGFDAVIGNPPWKKMKLEDKEWFAKRDESVSKAEIQADRKVEIEKLQPRNPILHADYIREKQLIAARSNVARDAGIYQELNKGDKNIYKLFVERTRQLVRNDGLISLVVPSGIVSDERSSKFIKKLLGNNQLISFYDFRNGDARYKDSESDEYKLKRFFKNVTDNIKFCIFTHATHAITKKVNYGCFLQSTDDITDPEKCSLMDAEDFNLVNPKTGTLPTFRSLYDKKLIINIYRNHPIFELDDIINREKVSAWRMKFRRMLDAANNSGLFTNEAKLKKAKCYSIGDNRYKNSEGIWLPLYKGEMLHLHDHRATIPEGQTRGADDLPPPFHWVLENDRTAMLKQDWVLAFRDVARSTDSRTFITAILPRAAYEHTCPILINLNDDKSEYLLYANFSTIPFDYIARNKVHDAHVSKYILDQLPVIDVDIYDSHKFGNKTAEQVIREIILELVYTATDLRGFAKDLDYVDDKGEAKPPFKWNEHRRLSLCAKLDAIYFILYGIAEDDNIKYIYSTFSNLDNQAKRLELCLEYKNALLNGECDIFYEVLG